MLRGGGLHRPRPNDKLWRNLLSGGATCSPFPRPAGILTLGCCRFRLPWLQANVVNLAVYDSKQRFLQSVYQHASSSGALSAPETVISQCRIRPFFWRIRTTLPQLVTR
ncbi:hypothetical protein AB1N83_014120 [Pleurotus pulmonarius]